MNYIFFLIPFLLVVPFAYAETGYDYYDTDNGDGTRTWQHHYPFVFDGNSWVPFIKSGNQIQTSLDTVILNADGSYTWVEKGITDKIVAKYADISNLNSWTYPNTLNNDTPDNSWNGTAFVSSKIKSGVGQLDYKYVFDNGKWKTQLEATNLSALTTKVFGFDEIVDLNSDTIKFGGVTRNLDNFNGTTFDKEFLEANEGKVIDLLNGVNFDFDKGFENLYSITVYDTGPNKSRLVFDYRTSEILLPGQTLIIDPSLAPTLTTHGRSYSGIATGTSCPAYDTSDSGIGIYKKPSDGSGRCSTYWWDYDISPINPSWTVLSAQFTITTADDNTIGTSTEGGILVDLPTQATGSSTTFNEAIAQTTKITSNNAIVFDGGGAGQVIDLNAAGISAIQSNLASGFYSFAITPTSWVRAAGLANGIGVIDLSSWSFSITYQETPPPDPVDDLTYANLSANTLDLLWTQPNLNGGNLTNYLINYTTPWGTPTTFLANTTNTYYNVTGLVFGTQYSYRVSALTEGRYNATGNILDITTTSTSYATPPVLTAFGPSSATTQINLEFPSSTMQNINGYRIQRETPISTGWVTIVSNTTSATQYYNNTGLSSNIIYNYRVYALNASGISTVSNTYDMTTFHLPDAVDDLTGSATDLSTIDLSWSAPTSYAPEIEGYMINGTTPTGEPVDILNSNTGTTSTTATALNLLIGQEYSFRVSPITVHGKNATGNIWNGSTIQTFVIGNLSNPDITNDDDFTIFFERTDLNSSAIQLDVTYPNSYDVSCDFSYKYARINQTYSGLTTVPDGADDQTATFILINATGDLVQVLCWDPATGVESTYVITITDFPFLQQVNNLRNGEYGTFFQIGAFDGVMLVVIFLGMIGLNRTTPIVGIVFVVITTLALTYFGFVTYPIIMYPALIMMIVWAFVTTRKDD